MGQQIRLTESELRNYILEAINEEMEEGAFTDTAGQVLGGLFRKAKDKGQEMAQNVKDKATAAYDNLKATYDANKEANQKISDTKKAAKTANKNAAPYRCGVFVCCPAGKNPSSRNTPTCSSDKSRGTR